MAFITKMTTRVKTEWWPVIAVFLIPFIFFGNKIIKNIPISYGDFLSQYYIWQSYLVNTLKYFHLPLWNPFVFHGTPFLANPQTATFYPINWLKIPFAHGGFLSFFVFQIFIVLEIGLGAVFFYLLLKYYVKEKISAFFGGLIYCLSPIILLFFIDWTTNLSVITWWPLMILCTEKFFERYERRHLVYLIFTLSLAWLAGHPSQFFLTFIGLIIFWLIKSLQKKNWRPLVWLIIVSFITLALVAVQIIPAFEFISQASRGEQVYAAAISIPSLFFLTGLFTPESYSHLPLALGVIAMFFIILSFFGVKKNQHIKTWIIFSLVSLIIYLFYATFGLRLTNNPILYNLIRYTERMLYYPVFSLTLLAGFGLPVFFDLIINNRRKIYIIFIFFMVAALTLISLGASEKSIYLSLTLFVFLAFFMFIFSRHETWQKIISIIIILANLGAIYLYYAPNFQIKGKQNINEYIATHDINDKQQIINNEFTKNSAMIYGKYAADGWDSLILSHYEKVSASQNIENLPRFWLIGKIKKLPTEVTMVKMMNEEKIDLKTFSLVTEDFFWENKNVKGEDEINLITEKPEKIELAIFSSQPQILVVNDNYYPGWRATLDGQPVKIERINVYMRAVKVPAGNHKIIIKYQPLSFRIGAVISLFTFLILLGCLIRLGKQKKP